MTTTTDIYVAKESFATTLDGESVSIQKGVTRVRAGHKLVKRHPEFFEPLHVHYDVEQASAKPGEQRGAPRPAQAPKPEPAPVPEPAPEPAPAPTRATSTASAAATDSDAK